MITAIIKSAFEPNILFIIAATDVNEVVTPKEVINLRSKPSVTDTDSVVVATVYAGTTFTRTGINNEYGWSRVEYNGQVLYCVSSYLKAAE